MNKVNLTDFYTSEGLRLSPPLNMQEVKDCVRRHNYFVGMGHNHTKAVELSILEIEDFKERHERRKQE